MQLIRARLMTLMTDEPELPAGRETIRRDLKLADRFL